MALVFKETTELLDLPTNISGTTYDKYGNIVGVDYSNTSLSISVVQKTLFLDNDAGLDRDYKVGDLVLLTAKAGTTGTMLGTVTLYTPNNQGLLVDVISITGSGTGTAWRITKPLPRQDYHPVTGVVRGAHFEPQSENVLTFSGAAQGSVISGTISESVINTVQNPEGNFSVRRLDVTVAGTYRYGDAISGSSGTQCVGSVYIMTEDGSESISVNCNGNTPVNYNIDNTQWVRAYAEGATVATERHLNLDLPIGVYYVFGKQMEEEFTEPTTYIPTDDVTEIRSANTHSVDTTLLATVLTSSEYTIAVKVEHEIVVDDGASEYTLFSLSDGTTNNLISISLNNAGAAVDSAKFKVVSGGTEVYSESTNDSEFLANNVYKAAIAVKDNDFIYAFHNTLGTPDLSGSIPTGLSELHIGSELGVSNEFRGWIHECEIYPERFSDVDLLELTDTLGDPLTI